MFDINMEGSLVKDNFDLFVESSNQPTVLTFEEIEVSDGVLNINMSASLNNSTISGIAIDGITTKTANFANLRKNLLNDVVSVENTKEFNNENLEITLYPNPADTETIVYINQEVQLKNILIHDMGGQLIQQLDPGVLKQQNGSYYLPLADMPQGVYLVSLLSESNLLKQFRLIINP